MLNTELFKPMADKKVLRQKYGIHPDKRLVLFGAADTGTENKNKGFAFLMEALKWLEGNKYCLAVFGNAGENIEFPSEFEVSLLGFISDEHKLAEIYNMADVFVNPSMQESFGYTVCESMACGTPAVAFPIGGLGEQISHKENGYLAEFKDAEDLARGIEYCCVNLDVLGKNARESALKYSYENMAGKYLKIFEQEIENNKK
jgi:glycosyltransferase involved in cell wall biosynthesis